VTKRIRLLVATLGLATAAATGTALTPAQPAADTTWGSPATPGDSTWDSPPANPDSDDDGSGNDGGESAPAAPADTTWG